MLQVMLEQTLFQLGSSTVFLINYRERYYLDAKLKLIQLEMKYAKEKGLGGIMFWELRNDRKENGLLDVIYETVNN